MNTKKIREQAQVIKELRKELDQMSEPLVENRKLLELLQTATTERNEAQRIEGEATRDAESWADQLKAEREGHSATAGTALELGEQLKTVEHQRDRLLDQIEKLEARPPVTVEIAGRRVTVE